MKKLYILAAAAMMAFAANANEMEYVDVTTDMFHNWTAADATGEQTEEATYPDYVLGTSVGPGGMVYGYSTVNYLSYANLSEYDVLEIVAGESFPRLLFNRTVNEGPVVEYSNEGNDWTITENEDGTKTYVIDLAAMVERDGFAHLHAIKATWGGPVTVYSLKAGKEVENPISIRTIELGKDAVIYNILGQRVDAPKAGQVYIVNGRKMTL